MPTRIPTYADFPPNLPLTITNPPPNPNTNTNTKNQQPPTNLLLLLHGLGDTAENFTLFAHALSLPETTVITLQAPSRMPLDLPGTHWGDDINFNPATGELDMDGGFGRALPMVVDGVVRDVLVRRCGYALREILVLGFGQGGMLGLLVARELERVRGSLGSFSYYSAGLVPAGGGGGSSGPRGGGGDSDSLAGVVSIGAPYPLSGGRVGDKSKAPVLLLSGRDSNVVNDEAVARVKDVFEFVEVRRYARKGDGMPRNKDEVLPLMEFFARRLRSRQGVPEGSVELS